MLHRSVHEGHPIRALVAKIYTNMIVCTQSYNHNLGEIVSKVRMLLAMPHLNQLRLLWPPPQTLELLL